MIKFKFINHVYLLFVFSFFGCYYSNKIIKLDLQKYKYEIETPYGAIIYEYGHVYDDYNFHTPLSPEVYFQFTNIKNITSLDFVKLRNEYKKYNIYVALEQINIIKIVAHELNKEICFMLMAEIFYNTGYINKKICVVETSPEYVYFGENSFINKNIQKFSFKESDTISQVITRFSVEKINKKVNIYNIINFNDFDVFLKELLKDNYFLEYTKGYGHHKIYANITILMGNKKIKIEKYNTLYAFKSIFLKNFFFREYDLEINEVNLYLNNAADIDIKIEENDRIILNQTNNVTILIFCFIILSIVWTIISRYNKNNNIEYPNNILDIY